MKPYVPCAISVRAKTSPLSTYAAVIVPRSWRSTASRGRIAAAATRRYGSRRLESSRMGGEKRYAVVSCHVERPLDDGVWARFEALQAARPGGLPVAALMRPPDAGAGEDGTLGPARRPGPARAPARPGAPRAAEHALGGDARPCAAAPPRRAARARLLPRHRPPRPPPRARVAHRPPRARAAAYAERPRRRSARLPAREDDDVRGQPRVNPYEAARDEVEPRLLEAGEESAEVARREEVQVRRVVLGLPTGEEAEPVLEPEAVRDGADEGAAGP